MLFYIFHLGLEASFYQMLLLYQLPASLAFQEKTNFSTSLTPWNSNSIEFVFHYLFLNNLILMERKKMN